MPSPVLVSCCLGVMHRTTEWCQAWAQSGDMGTHQRCLQITSRPAQCSTEQHVHHAAHNQPTLCQLRHHSTQGDGGGGYGGGQAGENGGAQPGGSYEFGVDPNLDPELAMALRVSLEEERARQAQPGDEAAPDGQAPPGACLSMTAIGSMHACVHRAQLVVRLLVCCGARAGLAYR